MIDALNVMRRANLADYGRYPPTADELMETAAVYCIAAEDRGGAHEYIRVAARMAVNAGREFPSAPAFAELVLQATRDNTRQVGLDLIDSNGRPVVEIVKVPRSATAGQVRAVLDQRARALATEGYSRPAPALPSVSVTRDQLLDLRRRLGERSTLARLIDQQSL